MTRCSALKDAQLQFAQELSLPEDALRQRAFAEVERVRKEEIDKARYHITELARLG